MMMQQRTRGCLLYFPVCFFFVFLFFFPCERIDIPTCSQDDRNITSFIQSEDVLTQKSACGCFFNEISMGRRRAAEEERGRSCCHTRNFSPFAQRQLIKGHGDSTSLNFWINLPSLRHWGGEKEKEKNLLVCFHLLAALDLSPFIHRRVNLSTSFSVSSPPLPPPPTRTRCSLTQFKLISMPSSCHLGFRLIPPREFSLTLVSELIKVGPELCRDTLFCIAGM